ncbi:MAG: accessory gene regulator B family protein [Oscillospiraceae bacterium]
MISRLSELILRYLLKCGVINDSDDDKEYYQYGIEITISSLLNVILIIGIGIIFRSMFESVVFLAFFMIIRQFTGGFHADTYFKCNCSFCISFISVLIMYHTTYEKMTPCLSVLISVLCVAIIILDCPIEHKNKPIPKHKRKFHKCVAAMLGIGYGIIGTILIALSNKYGALIIYTLVLVTLLVIAAIVKDRRCKYEE